MDEKIFELLESKDFNELNQNEQDLVLQHMSSEDYTASRLSVLGGIQEFDNEIKHTAYDSDLLKELHEKTRKKAGFIYFLINTRISLLKIAAVFIFLLFGYTFLLLNMLNSKEPIISDNSIKMDTVYITQTKTLKKTDTVFITKTKEILVDNEQNTRNTQTNTPEIINSNDTPNLKKIYAREALSSLKHSKNSTGTGLNLSAEDHPVVSNSSISDQTCITIDALCNM